MRSGEYGGFTVDAQTRNRLRPLAARDDRPVEEQIAERIREAIADGRFRQGERLPGIGPLARYYQVGTHIAYAALRILSDQGVVRMVRRIGTYVRLAGGEARRG